MKVNKLKIMHQPVLKKEAIKNLNIKKDGIYLDATLGEGGHAEGILQKLGSRGFLIGIDCDKASIERAERRLSVYKKRFSLIRENYIALPVILKRLKIEKLDGILLDLGLSSLQIDSRFRGFSFRFQAPLDMRMDERSRLKARDLINRLTEDELKKLFFQFGEERYSKRIAKNIARGRRKKPIEKTLELVKIIEEVLPQTGHFHRLHPATRIFQALRIAVNQELDNLRIFLKESIDFLEKRGRLAVISYHSLEDRIVKIFFRDLAKTCICPPNFPICRCNIQPRLKIINNKPLRPGKPELERNPRSRSAKLRIAERL